MNRSHSLGRNWGSFWVFLIILRYVERWQHPHYWTFDLHKFIHRKATIQLGGTRQPLLTVSHAAQFKAVQPE